MRAIIILSVAFVLAFIMGALLWPYTVNSWLVYFGMPAKLVWWQGGILGMLPYVGRVTIPAALGTWILLLMLA